MIAFHVRRDSLHSLLRRLNRLPGNVARRHLRRAYSSATTLLRRAVRSLIPVRSGTLRSALKKKVRVRREGGYGMVYVSARIAPHAHLIEFGTKERTTKSGAYRGRVEPVEFMRRARDAKEGAIRRALKRAIIAGIRAETGR